MTMKLCAHRWMIIALCANTAAIAVGEDTTYQSRKLDPQHKQYLNSDIYNSAAKVQAANDAESRSLQQQELCKQLIKAEKYDDALRVAHEIASTPGINAERRAAHHYLIAEIYNRKMEASPTPQLMEQNRQRAMQAAQEVIAQKYPAKWGCGEMATALLNNLQDPQHMQQVSEWVQKRQCNGCDSTKATFAKRQLAYMESAAKKTASAGAGGFSAVKKAGSSIFGVFGHKDKGEATDVPSLESTQAQLAAARPAQTSFSSPWGANSKVSNLPAVGSTSLAGSSLNLPGAGTVTFSKGTSSNETAANNKIGFSGKSTYAASRAPIVIDGGSVRRTTPIDSAVNQTDFSALAQNSSGNATQGAYVAQNGVEVAPGVTLGRGAGSTYASGQAPARGAVKN
jgi:hypothetical protein